MNRSQLLLWVLAGMFACGCAAAAEALPPSLRACMSESDASKRLACFDRESGRLAGESVAATRPATTASAAAPSVAKAVPPAAAPAATAPAAAAPAAAATTAAAVPAAVEKSAEEKFGYRGSIARADIDKKEEEERGGVEQLNATVTEVSTLAHGELLLTLDNGQVWQQKAGDRAMRIKVGDPVSIKRGSLRSFLLTSEAKGAKGSMRVTRVK
jgi:hypothetical protein